jgi:hypothetical protein
MGREKDSPFLFIRPPFVLCERYGFDKLPGFKALSVDF